MKVDRVGVRFGIIIGIVSAVLGAADSILAVIDRSTGYSVPGLPLAGCVIFLALLVLWFEGGDVAARQAGRVSVGAVAGAIAGFLGGIGVGFGSPVAEIQNGKLLSPAAFGVIVGIVFTILVAGLLFLGVGAGVGALGGLLGKSRYDHAKARDASLL